MTALDKKIFLDSIFYKLGAPGSFSGKAKLWEAVKKSDNPLGQQISENQVDLYLKRQKPYYKTHRKSRRGYPRYAPTRFSYSSQANIVWHGDNLVVQGFRGVYKYILIFVDAFSKKFFAKPLAKIGSRNVANAFLEIVKTQNGDIFPDVLITDRGSEFLEPFHTVVAEHGVRHKYTTKYQENKAFFAERAVRTLRNLMGRIYDTGERDLNVTLKAALESYNSSVQSTIGMSPNDAARLENTVLVEQKLKRDRHKLLSKYSEKRERINSQLQLGDLVFLRRPKGKFDKETVPAWDLSNQYTIDEIIQSEPLYSYRVVDLETGEPVRGTLTYFDLLPVAKENDELG